MNYDLEERTAKFFEEVIELVGNTKKSILNRNTLEQLIRSATSVGANYCEANNASSKKVYICKKEINETKYWLRLLSKSNPEKKDQIKILWREG